MGEDEYYELKFSWRIPKPTKILRTLIAWSPVIVYLLWVLWGAYSVHQPSPVPDGPTPMEHLLEYLLYQGWGAIGAFLALGIYWVTTHSKRRDNA